MANPLPRLTVLGALACAGHAQQVACEKFKLENGMTVILHEDHTLPVATVNLWYRVGAQDEPPRRSGFAHLFEHLMFMGTARVPGNQFDVLMEGGGGANNASTELHRTNYFSWGPAKLLPTLLWLDADRLEDMGNTMTQEKLDKQRDVVRNELRQNVENAPYGKAEEAVYKLAYPPTHPYYFGVIGTHEDLEAANVVNVRDFFANYYVASNASLVVAGDFKTADVKPLVTKLFGTLPAGAPVTRKYAAPTEPIPVKLDGTKRLSCIDAVQIPKVQMTWHSPVAYGPGDAEARLLAAVLSDGKSSRLYRRLVIQDGLASEVSASQHGYPLGSLFQVDAMVKPGVDLARVEAVIDEELAALCAKGPSPAELERAKATHEAHALSSLQSIARKADQMNEYEYYWGEPDSFRRDLERFQKVAPADVQGWAQRILVKDARVIVRVLPEKPDRAPSARDARPAEAPAAAFVPPQPESVTLANGMRVLVYHRPQLPLLVAHLLCKPGTILDAPGKQGLANLTARMLGEGSGELDALAFDEAVQAIGANFATYVDHETLHVDMSLLTRSQDRALGLFADAIRRPRFAAADFERVKSLVLEDLKRAADEPREIASRLANKLYWGEDVPYAWPTDGTQETVAKLTLADVKTAWATLLQPANCTLVVAGNLTGEAAKQAFERLLGDWTTQAERLVTRTGTFAAKKHDKLRVEIVDRPGATQTTILFCAPGVPLRDETRVPRHLLNTVLGGGFTSRLNQNLREEHGYTYGAGSRFVSQVHGGTFVASASVRGDATGAALGEFLKEFERIRRGDVQEGEAGKARETLLNESIQPLGSLAGLVGSAVNLLTHDLPLATLGADLAKIPATTTADLNALAAPAIAIDRGVLVLVGDKSVIEPQLERTLK